MAAVCGIRTECIGPFCRRPRVEQAVEQTVEQAVERAVKRAVELAGLSHVLRFTDVVALAALSAEINVSVQSALRHFGASDSIAI